MRINFIALFLGAIVAQDAKASDEPVPCSVTADCKDVVVEGMMGTTTDGVCGTTKVEMGDLVTSVMHCMDPGMCGLDVDMGGIKSTTTCNSSAGTIIGAVVGVVVSLIACGI